MHTRPGELPFPCLMDGCGYAAIRKAQLKLHMFTHTGERPFPCPVDGCGYAATFKAHLKKLTHTGERPFPCPVDGCGYAGTQRCKHQAKKFTGWGLMLSAAFVQSVYDNYDQFRSNSVSIVLFVQFFMFVVL